MQIKTTMRYHFTLAWMAIIKKTTNNKCCQGCGEKGTLYNIRNVNWYSHFGKQYGGYSKKLKIELPYDPAIPLLGIYPQKWKLIWKDTCSPMFIEALFKIVKIWK